MNSLLSLSISVLLLLSVHVCESSDFLKADLSFLDSSASEYEAATRSLTEAAEESQRLVQEMQSIQENIHILVEEQIPAVESLVYEHNAAAARTLMNRLADLETLELKRRENAAYQKAASSAKFAEMTDPQQELVEEMLALHVILAASDNELKQWASAQILAATEGFQTNATNAVTAITAQEETTLEPLTGVCVSTEEAATEVLRSVVTFSRDGIGMYDHAQDGTIVHQYTSATYSPPPLNAAQEKSMARNLLEYLVPQDWEQRLPAGWKSWTTQLPAHLLHSLGWTRGLGTAPPGAVLHPNVLPGSCWPMKGSSGSVMIRLASPIAIQAVSIEHASSMLLDQYGKEAYLSAPKKMKVFGMSACDTGCGALGFTSEKRELLAEFEFDVMVGGVQTFSVNQTADSSEEGSCAVEASTCSAPKPFIRTTLGVFAGVLFEVHDNYGNDAFTCLYRVRVHGDIAESTH